MGGNNGERGVQQMTSAGMASTHNAHDLEQTRPISKIPNNPLSARSDHDDYAEANDVNEETWESDALTFNFPGATIITEAWYRVQARQLIREFLCSVPRSEPEATLAIIRADGTQRLLTRGQLSAAIERLRPRHRQIIRLAVEERWSRQRVCEYLQNISIKTFERDHMDALDALAQL